MTVRRAALAISTHVFPLVATPLPGWAWWRIGHRDWRLVLGVPTIFGYATGILAARVVRRWRMTGRWQIGGIYPHHGFIYASKMAFVLLLATRDPLAVHARHPRGKDRVQRSRCTRCRGGAGVVCAGSIALFAFDARGRQTPAANRRAQSR